MGVMHMGMDGMDTYVCMHAWMDVCTYVWSQLRACEDACTCCTYVVCIFLGMYSCIHVHLSCRWFMYVQQDGVCLSVSLGWERCKRPEPTSVRACVGVCEWCVCVCACVSGARERERLKQQNGAIQ